MHCSDLARRAGLIRLSQRSQIFWLKARLIGYLNILVEDTPLKMELSLKEISVRILVLSVVSKFLTYCGDKTTTKSILGREKFILPSFREIRAGIRRQKQMQKPRRRVAY